MSRIPSPRRLKASTVTVMASPGKKASHHGGTSAVIDIETLSVITQVASFKLTGKRLFLMAPIHHHFEKKGWAEPKIIVRFWIVSILLALVSLASLKLR